MTEANELKPSQEFRATFDNLRILLDSNEGVIKKSQGAESLSISRFPLGDIPSLVLIHTLEGEINGETVELRVAYSFTADGVSSYQPSAYASIFPGQNHYFNRVDGFVPDYMATDEIEAKAMHEQNLVSLVERFLE